MAVEFLKQIKQIVEDGVHPQAVIKSYRKATNMVCIISGYFITIDYSSLLSDYQKGIICKEAIRLVFLGIIKYVSIFKFLGMEKVYYMV